MSLLDVNIGGDTRGRGRRKADGVKTGSAIALLIGLLLQGGLIPIAIRLFNQLEEGHERYEKALQKEIDQQREMLNHCLRRLGER